MIEFRLLWICFITIFRNISSIVFYGNTYFLIVFSSPLATSNILFYMLKMHSYARFVDSYRKNCIFSCFHICSQVKNEFVIDEKVPA